MPRLTIRAEEPEDRPIAHVTTAAFGKKREARIIDAIESNIDPLVRTLNASFGIATSNCRQEPEELLRIADEAMYQAKRSGTRIEVAA